MSRVIAVINLSIMTDESPAPPFPKALSPLLALIVRGAFKSYQSGEVDVEDAILSAAINGWYEGHVEGEECEGCPESAHDEHRKHFRRYPG